MDRATDDQIASYCCDVLYGAETNWIHRRKEAVEIQSETRWRHQASVDFDIPPALPAGRQNGDPTYFAPLLVLGKQPGQFSDFDVFDEAKRSVPLPTMEENTAISRLILVEAARRVAAAKGVALPPQIEAELGFVAVASRDTAASFMRELYEAQVPQPGDQGSETRKSFMEDDRFAWLLRTLALGSIVVFKVTGEAGTRRILQLSYTERIEDVTALRRKPLLAKVGAIFFRLGWRGYLMEKHSLFIAARSYHFELTSPSGLQVIEAGLDSDEPWSEDQHHVHLYKPDARQAQSSVAFAQFRVRGPSFVGAALVALTIAAVLASAWSQAGDLTKSTTSAPTLLLLFPGLIASYLARPAHPLVARLLNLARWALIASAATAYVGAARLAVVTSEHPASEQALIQWFRALTLVAALCAAILILAHLLPLRLSHPLRAAARNARQLFSS